MATKTLTKGALSWFELMTTNPQAAKQFYGKLFGWEFEHTSDPMEYDMIKVAGQAVAGIMNMSKDVPAGTPPHWHLFITVEDADQTAQQAKTLGGKVLMGPKEIPEVGKIAVIQDPQGAVICIHQPAER